MQTITIDTEDGMERASVEAGATVKFELDVHAEVDPNCWTANEEVSSQ